MTKLILIIFLIIFCYSCSDNSSENNLNVKNSRNINFQENHNINLLDTSFNNFFDIAKKFEPKSIDISVDLNKELSNVDIETIYRNNNQHLLSNASVIILLKLNYFHLTEANQGYNLNKMKKGKTATIINWYQKQRNISVKGKLFGSSHVWEIEKDRKNNNKIIKDLIKKIHIENNRIKKETAPAREGL